MRTPPKLKKVMSMPSERLRLEFERLSRMLVSDKLEKWSDEFLEDLYQAFKERLEDDSTNKSEDGK